MTLRMLARHKTNKSNERQKLMRARKMALIAALAVGSVMVLSPAIHADDTTNTPPTGGPPPGSPSGPGMRGRGPNFDLVAQRLNLTDDQKPKVKAILDDQWQQTRDLWQNQDLSREDRMAQMKSIHEATDAKLKTVLTADQFTQWQQMRPRMGGPRNGPPGAPPPGSPPPGGPPPDNDGTNAPAATPPPA
jgi:Spy/CpxP family protein refolding chaperone